MNNNFEKRRRRRRRKKLCQLIVTFSILVIFFLLFHHGIFLQQRFVPSSSPIRKHPDIITNATAQNTNNKNNSNKSNINTKNKKTLYWHVGPPKTATTYLQCGLCYPPPPPHHHHHSTHNKNNNTSSVASRRDAVLRQDGLVYLGTCPYAACRRIFPMPSLQQHRQQQQQNDEQDETFLKHQFGHFFTDLQNGTADLFRHMGPMPILEDEDDLDERSSSNHTVILAPQLKQQLQAAYNNPDITTVMLIYEGSHRFDAAHLRVLSTFLLLKQEQQQNWNVHIIVAYRRLYDWLPSKYNSVTKHYAKEQQWPIKTTTTTTSSLDKRQNKMPATNEEHVVLPFSLLGARADFSDMVHQIQTSQQHPTEIVMRNYQRYFDSVTIWDLHQSDDDDDDDKDDNNDDDSDSNKTRTKNNKNLLQQWFCRILPQMPHTCAWDWQANVDENMMSASSNPSVNLDYDMLAVAAYQHGLLPDTAQRRTTNRAIEDHVQRQVVVAAKSSQEAKNNATTTTTYEQIMPQACLPPHELQQLYDLSAAVEQRLFAWTVKRQEQHLANFRPSKYCALNVTAALELPFWQSFFKQYYAN